MERVFCNAPTESFEVTDDQLFLKAFTLLSEDHVKYSASEETEAWLFTLIEIYFLMTGYRKIIIYKRNEEECFPDRTSDGEMIILFTTLMENLQFYHDCPEERKNIDGLATWALTLISRPRFNTPKLSSVKTATQ